MVVEPELGVLRLQPNDLIVFSSPGYMSNEEASDLRDVVKKFGHSPDRVLILQGGATMVVLRNDDTG